MIHDLPPEALAAARFRGHAADLLGRLQVERAHSEARLAEWGRPDSIKLVTGRSAIDNAIGATRKMIADIDGMLASSI